MSAPLTRPALLRYGAFGMPLALAALPIYVYVPEFYATQFTLSLTSIGFALLAVRLLDAFFDPLIGVAIDRMRQRVSFLSWVGWACLPLAAGFIALFLPPDASARFPLVWMVLSLAGVYAGFSIATIAYQGWGAALSQDARHRTRLTATREGFGLIGVLLSAALPAMLGMEALLVFFLTGLLATFLLLFYAPKPGALASAHAEPTQAQRFHAVRLPFHQLRFRWLFAVFLVNGIAAAIPATLFLFFARDRLQLEQYAGVFLLLYFASGAASMPVWTILARRWGDARAWLAGMLVAIGSFVWTAMLPAEALVAFALVCIASGLALGADLALPPALLAGVIGHAGHVNQHEGAYFGIWNWASKLNLALAAGIALPALERLGYAPGATDPLALDALVLAYAVLPCLLKGIAALLLWRAPLRDL